MKGLLNKLFSTKQSWEFSRAELSEKMETLKNPARGWYTIYPFFLENEPDFNELYWCLAKEESLALVIINIGAYREKDLEEEAICRLRRILGFFVEHSYDVILRITYDHEGNAVEREPFFFKQVLRHLNQLIPVVKEFSHAVFIWQGMLIGKWGEMHTSRFLSADKMKQLWNVMKAGLPNEVYFAVRRPSMWRMLHPEESGKTYLTAGTMGLFDDAMFGSESHMGTFGTETGENVGWDSPWCREEEIAFEEQLCRTVPNGGEAVCGETYIEEFTPEGTLSVLARMHVTYLNRAYDEKILQQWKQWEFAEDSFYNYVGQHLGYRFVIRNVEVVPEKKEEQLKVELTIENTGFACCYQEAEVVLEQVLASGERKHIAFAADIRSIGSGETKKLTCSMEAAESELYISIDRKADGRRMYFANRSVEEGRVHLGKVTKVG